MDAMMAFFWDQEIRLADLKLSQGRVAAVEEARSLPASDPARAATLRRLLSGSYPTKADNTYRGIPKVSTDAQGRHIAAYSDGEAFTGDPERGEKLYALSCARCHGPEVDDVKAKYLSGDVRQFHRMLAKGTRNSDSPYMPNFTLERLSRLQGADILEFLQGF